ncbi:FecR family protein [Sphingomonas sp. OK281]|nr:FecR family protein [Sphingomonas sp. OK281]
MDDIATQALLWRLRLRYPDAESQRAFEAWLGEDVRHAAAYDASSTRAPAIDLQQMAANDDTQDSIGLGRRTRILWGGGLITASAAALALVFVVSQFRAAPYEVATGPGGQRVVALDAGTRITLAGDTRMRFDRHDARTATLLAGQALFQIRHDAAHPFGVEVAGRVIQDVGTVFDVSSTDGDVRVAVAEGSVIYNPDREAVTLTPGEGVVDAASSTTLRLISAPAVSVGGWRNGQFVYAGDPLATVAADLGRALGVKITVAPEIAARPFSGAITLDGRDPGQLLRLTPALDATIRHTSGGWTISADGRASK